MLQQDKQMNELFRSSACLAALSLGVIFKNCAPFINHLLIVKVK